MAPRLWVCLHSRTILSKSPRTRRGEALFDQEVVVWLDAASHPELLNEGLTRDVVNRVQKLCKTAVAVLKDEVQFQ